MDALRVQLGVELLQHVGSSDVDVGGGFALEDDPARLVIAHATANLLAEQAQKRKVRDVDVDTGGTPVQDTLH